MESYDIVIVGGSTAGCYFAKRMAQKGYSVLVLEKDSRETVSPDYDVFHMGYSEMKRFNLTIPNKDDDDYCFEFEDSAVQSAFGHYPKPSKKPVVGMHKHLYILRMSEEAKSAGAHFLYNASFTGFLFTNGKITGVRYTGEQGADSVSCRLVADCSGIPAVARCSLPSGYGVETFHLTPNDMFFVTLRYIHFTEKKPKRLRSDSWLFYKTWLAPCDDSADAILGVGSNFSFDYAEKVFNLFTKNVKLPTYLVSKIEKGRTPYHRPPYSFVADGFIAMGDAACLTKPFNGEGCTAALVQSEIAVDVVSRAMKNGAYPTREAMWSVNKRYVDEQGKAFASLLAMLTGAVNHNAKENEFCFKHDIIFSKKVFSGVSSGVSLTVPDYVKTVLFILIGIIAGKVRPATIKRVSGAVLNGGKVKELYEHFPDTADRFDEWVKKADELWNEIGSMSDFKLIED